MTRAEKDLLQEKMDLPEEVQRSVASYTVEGSRPVRKGDKLFGRDRRIAENCLCGLCVASEAQASTCTLFGDGGARVVQRTKSEVCVPVCLSRSPIRMILKLIARLIPVFLDRVPPQKRAFVRVTLQRGSRPDWTRPYVFDALYDCGEGELQVSLLTPLAGKPQPDLILPGYQAGSAIPSTSFRADLQRRLERLLLEGDGGACSLVVVAPGSEAGNVTVGSLFFERTAAFAHRARVYIFAHAQAGEGALEHMRR